MIRRNTPNISRRQNGFSLIEVMIALLVLALGLLGLAFLQVLNVRYTSSAEHRTMATNLASEVIDMMRSNPRHVILYNRLSEASFDDFDPPENGCANVGEDAANAVNNVERWRCDVAAQLPNGVGVVTVVGSQAAGYNARVRISWTDDVGKTANATADSQGIGKTTTFEVDATL